MRLYASQKHFLFLSGLKHLWKESNIPFGQKVNPSNPLYKPHLLKDRIEKD